MQSRVSKVGILGSVDWFNSATIDWTETKFKVRYNKMQKWIRDKEYKDKYSDKSTTGYWVQWKSFTWF